jgi:hypothetical protein
MVVDSNDKELKMLKIVSILIIIELFSLISCFPRPNKENVTFIFPVSSEEWNKTESTQTILENI